MRAGVRHEGAVMLRPGDANETAVALRASN